MEPREHWNRIYSKQPPESLGWYREHLETSLGLIERAAPDRSAAILDVGGGASTLVDDLLVRGYGNLTVLDLSSAAMEAAQGRFQSRAQQPTWVIGDVTQLELPPNAYDLWHDRAVFHFFTRAGQRAAYLRQLTASLKPGGTAIVATFGPEGPTRCSGMDVVRYSAAALQNEFGPRFCLLESLREVHTTPAGIEQDFLYCVFRLLPLDNAWRRVSPRGPASINRGCGFAVSGAGSRASQRS